MKKIVLLTALMCLLFAFQSAFAKTNITEPKPIKNPLPYDGTQQFLTTFGETNNTDLHFVFWNDSKSAYTPERPNGHYPGIYTVKYCLAEVDPDPVKCVGYKNQFTVEIRVTDPPTARTGLVYNGGDYVLINAKTAPNKDVYYYRITSPASQKTEWRSYEGPQDDYTLPRAKDPGIYTVEYIIVEKGTVPSETVKGKEIKACIASLGGTCPTNNGGSGGNSGSGGSGHYSFYTIGDGYGLFEGNRSLPATGFPTRFTKPLSIKPDSVRYEDLSMRIQIPSINVDVELTGVPEYENTWAVEWLDNKAGILSGSAMPGDGYTLVAAHNHLNSQEIGPFAFLIDLKENDRIFVNMPDEGLKMYSVYANELLEPNDFSQMAAISENEEGSLILITCENEMIDGGYQNRRVVFAKLMN